MTDHDPGTSARSTLRLFGWCLPGLEADHGGCRADYISTWDGQRQVCQCDCHAVRGATR